MKLRGWVAAAVVTASFLGLAMTLLGSVPTMTKPYWADIRSAQKALAAFEGETAVVTLAIKNEGSTAWEPKGDAACFVSYHILDVRKNVLRFENPRFSLPVRVSPGGSARLPVVVKAPLDRGDYLVEFDLLVEGRLWFRQEGSATLSIPLKVTERDWPEKGLEPGLDAGAYSKIESSVPEFKSLMKLVRITLKHNEVSFPGKSGLVDGFAAGSGYPQIWLRDASTIIPASKYFYPLPRLDSWLIEHLALQRSDGSLWDWVDSRGTVDKNTVETDQEASAVQAAFQLFGLAGKDWLSRTAAGMGILDRLERALSYVLKERFDPETGLVTGAHTADWGDVESDDADEKAVYLGPTSRLTFDIYDQSMFTQAALELASMFEAAGEGKKAATWRDTAGRVKTNANLRFWMPDKGYYRVHVHKDRSGHDFAEDDIFAMGGNVQAVISSLAADPETDRAGRIIEKALALQKELGISTVSGTLLPPYPRGFFKHPAMDEEFEYQNGGQWDWFGGRLVLIMFRSGYARTARAKLIEIVKKNVANGGFFEWDSRDGGGRGSDFFTGSAGSLTRALVEGYLGIRVDSSGLELSPRLGLDEARVHFRIPAAGKYAAYDYRVDPEARTVRLEYRCDYETGPAISILNPWSTPQSGHSPDGSAQVKVRVNGDIVPFKLDRIGRDEYIRPEASATRLKTGVVEIRIHRKSPV